MFHESRRFRLLVPVLVFF